MKKKFEFPKDWTWDGDEDIIHWIMEKILYLNGLEEKYWNVKNDYEVIVEIKKKNK